MWSMGMRRKKKKKGTRTGEHHWQAVMPPFGSIHFRSAAEVQIADCQVAAAAAAAVVPFHEAALFDHWC